MPNRPPSDQVPRLVDPVHRDAFTRFVNTGELDDPAFTEFLTTNARCQQAIELMATEQLDALRSFGQSLREPPVVEARAAAADVSRADADPLVSERAELVTSRTAAAAGSPRQAEELRRALASRLVAG
ncbi:MAG: hypothetical protein IT361_13900 [Gemmatimonadaceae bacterium]|nr:hypothetical protein [Gemmatimonadaceae bacterium]